MRASRRNALTMKDIDGMMVSLSNWGRWGSQDEMGALNLITPRKRRVAARLVKEGVSISLAKNTIKSAMDDSPPFQHRMIQTGEMPDSESSTDIYSVQYHGFTQTHLDALCHFFYAGKMYNGFSKREVSKIGAARLSVINMKHGIFTRGLLMDFPRLWGLDFLEGGRRLYPDDLESWEKGTRTQVRRGDAIFIRTGRWVRRSRKGEWKILEDSAGLHASCLPWLKKRDIAILGSDLAADVMPSGVEGVRFPIHLVVIVAMGVPIFDNCDLEMLSEAASGRKRWEFLFNAAPLPVEGGTGSPINPIATF